MRAVLALVVAVLASIGIGVGIVSATWHPYGVLERFGTGTATFAAVFPAVPDYIDAGGNQEWVAYPMTQAGQPEPSIAVYVPSSRAAVGAVTCSGLMSRPIEHVISRRCVTTLGDGRKEVGMTSCSRLPGGAPYCLDQVFITRRAGAWMVMAGGTSNEPVGTVRDVVTGTMARFLGSFTPLPAA